MSYSYPCIDVIKVTDRSTDQVRPVSHSLPTLSWEDYFFSYRDTE